MSVYVAPKKRTIKRGMKGRDVLASKYALEHAELAKGILRTQSAGIAWERNLKAFQRRKKLKVTGTLNDQTWHALRYHVASVPYAAWLWNHYTIPHADQRAVVVNTALYGAAHEGSIHYTQSALRMQGVRNRLKPPKYPRYEDCSSFSTWCYWVAGAPDPNGLGYSGFGYTGTLCNHGRVISFGSLRPGDLVFYGGSFSVPGHVAVYIGGGKVVSHGSESGPKVANVGYRPINHCRSYLP